MAQYILLALMFMGGCQGSTAGSIKVVRLLLLIKHAFLQLSVLIHPREVRSLKLDHKPGLARGHSERAGLLCGCS